MSKVELHTFYPGGYCNVSMSKPHRHKMLARLRPLLISLLKKHDAQAIAVTGTSGLSVAYEMRARGMTLKTPSLPFLHVRKEKETNHGGPVESLNFERLEVRRYIILDDFISSGATVQHIVTSLHYCKPALIVLYSDILDANSMRESKHKCANLDGDTEIIIPTLGNT